jgi:predicted regulator of Ras-like GTPase activity (Roadblock/LC7/MglB family)
MIASADLSEICAQLQRDSGGKKVMLCSAEGEVLAHAGNTGALDERVGEALAQLIADVVEGATSGRVPATQDLVASVPGGLPGGLSACATAIADKAALVVLFDTATSLGRVRLKIRRARELLLKSLPLEPAAGKPDPS